LLWRGHREVRHARFALRSREPQEEPPMCSRRSSRAGAATTLSEVSLDGFSEAFPICKRDDLALPLRQRLRAARTARVLEPPPHAGSPPRARVQPPAGETTRSTPAAVQPALSEEIGELHRAEVASLLLVAAEGMERHDPPGPRAPQEGSRPRPRPWCSPRARSRALRAGPGSVGASSLARKNDERLIDARARTHQDRRESTTDGWV
jgi:hypothetical protein